MLRSRLAAVAAVTVALLSSAVCSRKPERWPSRPIELVVFSAPGGGTDLANRVLATAMERELGTHIRVSNRTGGRGGAAAQYVFQSQPDGYRWLGASDTVLSLAVRGAHPSTSKDWHYFIFAGSPGVISVSGESPYQSFDDLLRAAWREPNQMTVAASGPGSIWHLRAEILRHYANFSLRYIPYQGSSPSQVAALSGEVEVVLTALAEQLHYIRAKQLRPLVMVETEGLDLNGAGFIPAVTDWFPELQEHFPLPQWLGFMVSRETPPEIVQNIRSAFQAALRCREVEEFLRNTGNQLYGLSGVEADRMAQRLERILCWMLYDLQLVQHSPERFGILRPGTDSNE